MLNSGFQCGGYGFRVRVEGSAMCPDCTEQWQDFLKFFVGRSQAQGITLTTVAVPAKNITRLEVHA